MSQLLRKRYGALLFALLVSSGRAMAQGGCSISGNGNNAECVATAAAANFSIPQLAELVTPGASTFSLAPAGGTITVADFTAGSYNVASTLQVTARANYPWAAYIRATSGQFTSPCADKAAGALRWGRTAGSATTSMLTTANSIFPSTTNAATAGATVTLFFSVLLDWTKDPPGTCNLPLSLSIGAPLP